MLMPLDGEMQCQAWVCNRINLFIHIMVQLVSSMKKELTQLYLAEGLGYRIISVIPQDATREWVYVWDDKSRAILDREFERLGAEEAFYNALVFQRTYGGSLIIIGAMDGNTIDKPLNLKGIRSIEYLKAVDNTCVNISESEWDMNPSSLCLVK